jgi:hypothetical protein
LSATAVANDIQVRLPGGAPTDPEIAHAAATALACSMPEICAHIQPRVEPRASVERDTKGRIEAAFRRLA